MSDEMNNTRMQEKWAKTYEQYQDYRDYEIHEHELEDWKAEIERSNAMKDLPELQGKEVRYGYMDPTGQVQNDPLYKGAMDMACERVREQMKTAPVMPDNENLTLRFPGVDPKGKHSIIAMKFAQRQAQLDATVATKSLDVQAYYNEMKKEIFQSDFGKNLVWRMQEADKTHKMLDRSSKLALNPIAGEMLHVQKKALETDLPVAQYNMMLEGLEFAAGVRSGLMPKETRAFYRDTLAVTPPSEAQCIHARGSMNPPTTIDIAFPNFDNQLLQMVSSNPKHWGKTAKEMEGISVPEARMESAMIRYATATASRALTPLFESKTSLTVLGEDNAFPVEKTILIDGKSAYERLQESGVDLADRRASQEMTARMVACALMSGRQVDAFIPDENGNCASEPTRITKSGYQPDPMKKVSMNIWQRFWNSVGGFYQEKADKVAEYDRVMAARENFKAEYPISFKEPLDPKLADRMSIVENAIKNNGPVMRKIDAQNENRERLMVGERETYLGNTTANPPANGGMGVRTTRMAPASYGMCQLVLAGHSAMDILEPNNLRAEKKAAGDRYRQIARLSEKDTLQTQEEREQYKHLLPKADQTPEVLGDANLMRTKMVAQVARDRVEATEAFLASYTKGLKDQGFDFTNQDMLEQRRGELGAVTLFLVDNNQEYNKTSGALSKEEQDGYKATIDKLFDAQCSLNVVGLSVPKEKGRLATGSVIDSVAKVALAEVSCDDIVAKDLQNSMTEKGTLFGGMSSIQTSALGTMIMMNPKYTSIVEPMMESPSAINMASLRTSQGAPVFKVEADLSKPGLPELSVLPPDPQKSPKAPEMKAPEPPVKKAPEALAKKAHEEPRVKGR